jgi:cytochrome c-type biogenesis protein CcmH/NrfG
VAFVVISSLVICSLLAAGLIGAVQLDLLGNDSPDDDVLNDPNEDVIAEAQTAVAEDPDNFERLLLLGNLLGNSNRVEESIPVYEQAIALRPDDATARFSFARVLDEGGMEADAEVQYLKAIELNPQYQAAHYYLAEMYRMSQPSRVDEAIPHYQRAIEIDPASFMAEQSKNQLSALGVETEGSPASATPNS